MNAVVIILGGSLGAAFIVLLRAARGERLWPLPVPRTQPASSPAPYTGFHDDEITVVTPIGIFTTGFAWRPDCSRQEVMFIHRDRSAHCDHCGTYIPAGEAA